ncbi:MAG: DUF6440 family protein [Clostridiales Family XIII bacterium]|nr:DUF6440 family protein [Clostridiales Family XIII bacterium]
MKNSRFDIQERDSVAIGTTTIILIDKETGVNYLMVQSGYGAGLTPLLDENGNVVVTKDRDSNTRTYDNAYGTRSENGDKK